MKLPRETPTGTLLLCTTDTYNLNLHIALLRLLSTVGVKVLFTEFQNTTKNKYLLPSFKSCIMPAELYGSVILELFQLVET
jgi:hypothetical protein